MVKNLPAHAGDEGSVPESGRSPGAGNGNPLQYSWLGNPVDRGAWRATVHGVTVRHDLAIEQQDAKLLQSCLTLYDPMDHSLPGSSVHGKNTGVRLPCPPPGNLPGPEIEPASVSCTDRRFFTTSTTWEAFNSDPHWNSPNQHSPRVYRYLQLDGRDSHHSYWLRLQIPSFYLYRKHWISQGGDRPVFYYSLTSSRPAAFNPLRPHPLLSQTFPEQPFQLWVLIILYLSPFSFPFMILPKGILWTSAYSSLLCLVQHSKHNVWHRVICGQNLNSCNTPKHRTGPPCTPYSWGYFMPGDETACRWGAVMVQYPWTGIQVTSPLHGRRSRSNLCDHPSPPKGHVST